MAGYERHVPESSRAQCGASHPGPRAVRAIEGNGLIAVKRRRKTDKREMPERHVHRARNVSSPELEPRPHVQHRRRLAGFKPGKKGVGRHSR